MTTTDLARGIEEIDDSQGSVVTEWERLAERVDANPFLHPGFVLAWQRAFGRRSLLLATVRRQGELVGALPLVRRGGVLASPANWHTPLCGVLSEDADAATALGGLISSSRARRISLAFIDRGDESTNVLATALAHAGYRIIERTLARSPYLELLGDWAEFEAGMKSSTRTNLRRLRRRLEERGTVSMEELDGSTRLGEGLEEVIRIEGLAWKGGRGTAIDSQRQTREFYGDVARWAAKRGWLRIHILRLDRAPIAVSLAIEAHQVFFGIKLGYDPAYSRMSPGSVMLNELVRRAFENGLSRFEMLGADEAYKRTWCPDVHERVGLQAFSPSIAGQLDRLLFAYARPLVKRLASKSALGRFIATDAPRL